MSDIVIAQPPQCSAVVDTSVLASFPDGCSLDLMKKIQSIDLTKIKARVGRKLKWNDERVNAATEEYRRFLFMICNSQISDQFKCFVPSQGESIGSSTLICSSSPITVFPFHTPIHTDVDEVWHAHILDTSVYVKHCNNILGEFIHHRPTDPGENGGTNNYVKTLVAYKVAFGLEPNPAVWHQHVCDDGPAECGGPSECDNGACTNPIFHRTGRGQGDCNSSCDNTPDLCTGGPGECEGDRTDGQAECSGGGECETV